MWPWRKENTNVTYKDIILKGFPISMRQDVEIAFAIIPLDHNVEYRFGQVVKVNKLVHEKSQIITLDKETLEIPSRVYFNEPTVDRENDLTDLQKAILNCIYLRHHNGLVRQKRLQLLTEVNDYFVIPYKFHLLGEYVIEILEDLQKHITTNTIDNFVKFVYENGKYFAVVESKMANFWNVHYRWKSQTLKNYIGRKNIDLIKKRTYNTNTCKK
jgi:hypothetical protein